jgi:hypothetical protein
MVKKAGVIIVVLSSLTIASGAALWQTWRQHAAVPGHHLFLSPPQTWGFYRLMGGETMVAYPPGQPDYNTITDIRQYGPLRDWYAYPACLKQKPFC